MRVNIGDIVQYIDKKYKIIHIYVSNYCEIREEGTFKTILVHADDVQILPRNKINAGETKGRIPN